MLMVLCCKKFKNEVIKVKFDKNERFQEIFKLRECNLKDASLESILSNLEKVEESKALDYPIRDYVLSLDFSDRGFHIGNTVKVPKSTENILNYLNQEFREFTFHSYNKDTGTFKVTPNFIINIRKNEIYNIFDSISKMRAYGFFTTMDKDNLSNWKFVTAIDRIMEISIEDDLFQREDGLNRHYEDDLNVDVAFYLIKKYNINLAKVNSTIREMAEMLQKGNISEKDFENGKIYSI